MVVCLMNGTDPIMCTISCRVSVPIKPMYPLSPLSTLKSNIKKERTIFCPCHYFNQCSYLLLPCNSFITNQSYLPMLSQGRKCVISLKINVYLEMVLDNFCHFLSIRKDEFYELAQRANLKVKPLAQIHCQIMLSMSSILSIYTECFPMHLTSFYK